MEKEMKKVDLTLAQRGRFAAANTLDGTALLSLAYRDIALAIAGRAAALADDEDISEETFRRVNAKVNAALGR